MKNALNFRPQMILAVLLTHSLGTWTQSITLEGIMEDDLGEGVIGASILQKGIANGTVTGLGSNFALTAPNRNTVLVISFTGCLMQEIAVGNQTHFNVLLKEDIQNLDEMIVIGYGTARGGDLTGAVTRTGMGALEKSPNVNVLQSLGGVIPGLNIGIATKAGDSPTVSIRGYSSVPGSTESLVVLDEVIYHDNIPNANPNDIASINVLEDAGGAAVYGS